MALRLLSVNRHLSRVTACDGAAARHRHLQQLEGRCRLSSPVLARCSLPASASRTRTLLPARRAAWLCTSFRMRSPAAAGRGKQQPSAGDGNSPPVERPPSPADIDTVCGFSPKELEQWETYFATCKAEQDSLGSAALVLGEQSQSQLRQWELDQRARLHLGILSASRKARLGAAGFKYVPFELGQVWAAMLEELRAHHATHGTADVSTHALDPKEAKLARWVKRQRTAHCTGELMPERQAALEALGVTWEPQLDQWETYFAALEVVQDFPGNEILLLGEHSHLHQWVLDQRARLRLGTLSASRKTRLDAAGFDWKPFDNRWEEIFAQLQQYAAEQDGNTAVPQRYADKPPLGWWVHAQRKKRETMSPERRAALNSIDFQWGATD